MAGIDDLGIENAAHGICGFTSTLYAVYMNRPHLRNSLESAVDVRTRGSRLPAEIKTFLQMLRAQGNESVLRDITTLTRSFPNYESWNVDWYIGKVNKMAARGRTWIGNYSIAMPPEATMEYMRTMWDMRPVLSDSPAPGDLILGLTRTGGPQNRWRNLAHYVYQSATGRIYSWGEQFDDLADVNDKKGRDYSVIYRIEVHG